MHRLRPGFKSGTVGAASLSSILALAFVLLLAWFIKHINGPRVVARAVAPDGTEMCIIQKCNWGGEPFTTSFYYRKPGGQWGWFYYDHEDWYWSGAKVSLDTNASVATFYRKGKPDVNFAWNTETYTLKRRPRTITGAQTWLPPGQSPF